MTFRAREAWVTVFLTVAFAPAVLRYFAPERQLLGPEVITITGLLATALLVCTVVLPSRLRSITRAFGIEAVLTNHRALGTATALATLAHVAAVVANDPRGVGLLLPFFSRWQPDITISAIPLLNPLLSPPGRALAGTVSTACLVALAVVSARRKGSYEVWRRWHLALAAGALLGMVAHIVLIAHLVPTAALVGVLRGDPLGWFVLRSSITDWYGLSYLVLLALAVFAVAVHRWVLRPLHRDAQYYVIEVLAVSDNVSSIRLRPLGRTLRFRPGQFAWLRLARDPLRSEEHPFTVSSGSHDLPTVEFTIKHGGDWTGRLRRLRQGDLVYVDGPYGSFSPNPHSRRGLVLIAAGVGITPMMSILRTAAHDRWWRSIRVLLTDRPGTGIFRDELALLQKELPFTVHELPDVDADLLDALLPTVVREEMDYFVCGPPGLLHDAGSALCALGVPPRRIHTEKFDV